MAHFDLLVHEASPILPNATTKHCEHGVEGTEERDVITTAGGQYRHQGVAEDCLCEPPVTCIKVAAI